MALARAGRGDDLFAHDGQITKREVRAVTAQGRLSGWVVGGLVPASAVILLLSNPRYIDVLFNTLPGQALLVLALLLQLVGWLIISRLVQLDY
jgi:tight adherence protein B